MVRTCPSSTRLKGLGCWPLVIPISYGLLIYTSAYMLLLWVQICTLDLGKEFHKFTAQLESKLFLIRKHN